MKYAKVAGDLDSLESRVAALTQALLELVDVVERLNSETYLMAKSEFERIPEKPRVSGYPELQATLERLRATLEGER